MTEIPHSQPAAETRSRAHAPDLLAMAEERFNQPALFSFDLARIIGYGEDEDDCYIIARHRGGKVVWHTCVGGYVFLDRLAGQEEAISGSGKKWDDLIRLDSMLSMNGSPRAETFRIDLQHEGGRKSRPLAVSEEQPKE